MFKILSYPIKDGEPTWPGNPTCSLQSHTSIAKGDTANTATIYFHLVFILFFMLFSFDKGSITVFPSVCNQISSPFLKALPKFLQLFFHI